MKSLFIIIIYGRYKVLTYEKGVFSEFESGNGEGNFCATKVTGVQSWAILNDVIPYTNNTSEIENYAYIYGTKTGFLINMAISICSKDKSIDSVYVLTTYMYKYKEYKLMKEALKQCVGKDLLKGLFGVEEVFSVIGLISYVHKVDVQFALPYLAGYSDYKKLSIDCSNGLILVDHTEIDEILINKFSKYLNIYSKEKNYRIIKRMVLAGIYQFLYTDKTDDIVNIYQDRRIVIPFNEIVDYFKTDVVKNLKEHLDVNKPLYTVNNKAFNECFSEYNIVNHLFLSEDNILLYLKMLSDFNSDISLSSFKARYQDYAYFFGDSIYGRKSTKFKKEQEDFVKKNFIK